MQLELEGKSVAEIARQYKVLIVHGIMPNLTPNPNSVVKEGTPWQRKLEIVLALQPTLSTSSIKPGDTDREMWSRMGVILNSGFVLSATPNDGESRVQTIRSRKYNPRDKAESIDRQIEVAITQRDQSERRRNREFYDYNELVIANPGVAGFYVCLNRVPEAATDEWLTIKDVAPFDEIMPALSSLGLRLYLIQDGQIYHGVYDESQKAAVLQAPVTIEALLQQRYTLPESRREEIIDGILHDSPFKLPTSEKAEVLHALAMLTGPGGNPENRIGLPDLFNMESRFNGQRFYVELNTTNGNFPRNLPLLETNYTAKPNPDDFLQFGYFPRREDEILMLTSICGPEKVEEYILVTKPEYPRKKEVHVRKRLYDQALPLDYDNPRFLSSYNGQNTLLDICRHYRLLLSSCVRDVKDYFKEMGRLVQMGTRVLDPIFLSYFNPDQIEAVMTKTERIAFHIYGFGEEAQKWGDLATKERAFQIASQIVPVEEYKRAVRERVGLDGRFQLTRDDLAV